MHKPLLISVLVTAALLAACSTDPEQSRAVPVPVPTNPDGSPVTGVLTANFDPSTGVVPTPNNLVYSGTADGTLNIPVANPANFSDPLVAINALDGWSTVAPITTTFSAPPNPATIQAGGSIRMFQVTLCSTTPCPPVGGPVSGVVRQLAANEFTALINPSDPSGTQLVILPLRPLPAKSHFVVVITNGVADAAGNAATPSQIYGITKRTSPLVDGTGASTDPLLPDANAQALEPLRVLTNSAEIAVSAASGIARDAMALTWIFSTQSTTDVFDYIFANATARAHTISPVPGVTLNTLNASLPTWADVYVGTIDLPYYLQAPGDTAPANPARVLGGFWQGVGGSNLTKFNPAPVARSTQTVPVLMSIPNGTSPGACVMPVAGWPIVVFQHGITGNRTNMLGMAAAAAQACFAVIAIDQPLHGITDTSSGLYAANPGGLHALTGTGTNERTFDVDLINNTTSAPGPDGNIDGSGSHTINQLSLLTARDNLRQATSDLLNVLATIPTMATLNAQAFDDTRIHFVGHSLGAMVGTAMLGASTDVASATLGMPGGGIARLLHGSATFGPRIQAGLAAAGVAPNSPDYDRFMFAAQTVVDSADPINHAIRAATNSPIHMVEVVGNGGTNLPDQVVPNAVAGAPLSGTEPLARAMALASVSTTTTDAAGVRGIVRFTAGNHSSLLDPTVSAAAYFEMQTQMATFFATFGTTLLITDNTVVQQP